MRLAAPRPGGPGGSRLDHLLIRSAVGQGSLEQGGPAGYTLAVRAPWLFRLYFAKLGRAVRRDATSHLSLFPELGLADRDVLAGENGQELLQQVMTEAFRQGARGPAHDYILEARPWGVPLDKIRVPVEIWHGDDDWLVSPEQPRILAEYLPLVETHLVPDEGRGGHQQLAALRSGRGTGGEPSPESGRRPWKPHP